MKVYNKLVRDKIPEMIEDQKQSMDYKKIIFRGIFVWVELLYVD